LCTGQLFDPSFFYTNPFASLRGFILLYKNSIVEKTFSSPEGGYDRSVLAELNHDAPLHFLEAKSAFENVLLAFLLWLKSLKKRVETCVPKLNRLQGKNGQIWTAIKELMVKYKKGNPNPQREEEVDKILGAIPVADCPEGQIIESCQGLPPDDWCNTCNPCFCKNGEIVPKDPAACTKMNCGPLKRGEDPGKPGIS
jgi:hypothetical protein